MKMRLAFFQTARAMLACAGLLLATASCTKVGSNLLDGRVNTFTQPHVLRIAMDEDVTSLNPWFSNTVAANDVATMTMAYLFQYDAQSRPRTELASEIPTLVNGGVSANGLVITYRLRKGVRWSDGAAFNADDVVFSFRQYLNNRNNVSDRTGWKNIVKIEKLDRYTVRIVLDRPYSSFLSTFFSGGGPCILPVHLLGKYAELNDVPYNAMPVGIGPFRVLKWKRADEVVLEPNPYYFRGLPKLQRVEFHIVTNQNTVLQEMQAGNLDLWIGAPAYFIDQLRALSGYSVALQPAFMFSHIDFNLAHPIVADRAVREALRDATNRQLIWEKISHKIGILQESPLSPVYPNAPPVVPMLPYDRDAAVHLLEQAGWKVGADGVRQKDGHELRLEFAMGPPQASQDAAVELLRGWWQDIGIAIDVKHYDAKLLFAPDGIINKGKYDITTFSWQLGPFDSLYPLFGCDTFAPIGQNTTHYCNPEADKLMRAIDRTYNASEQRKLEGQVIDIVLRDVPLFVTGIRENIWVANADLKGFHPGPATSFNDMLNVDI